MKQGKENTERARIQATLMLPVTNMITNSNIITNFGSFVFFFSLEVFVKSEKLKFEINQCFLNETFLSSITSFFFASTLEGGDGIE